MQPGMTQDADNVPSVPARGHSPAATTPKAQDAYRALHEAIRVGEYLPGARLKEIELAQHLGMSRTPIREAIRQLERDGVVTVLPNRGAVVRELSEQEIDDTYSLRAVLEGYCASRAATRMGRRDLEHLEQIEAEFERRISANEPLDDDASIEALILLNRTFHDAIVNGSQNTRITDILHNATEVPVHMKQLYWRSPRARAGALVHHREIIEALLARDAVRADAVMRTHVYAVKDFFMRQHRAGRLERLVGHEDGAQAVDVPPPDASPNAD